MRRHLLAVSLIVGCQGTTEVETPATGPLGIALTEAGDTRVGVAVVDLTPTIPETFDDSNGNFLFEGCFDDPVGTTRDCPEGFDDVNGNGIFDARFIGGFSPLRPARTVRDPITARAIVLQDGGSYAAFVVLDLVGLAHPRIDDAADLLAAQGFDRDKLLVLSTHNHQGPDTMGLWGNPEACLVPGDPDCRPGFDVAYQEQVTAGIVQAVEQAASSMEAVSLRVGAVKMRERSRYFNGTRFGGVNPTAKMLGMVHDIRDPVIVSDQVLAIQARRADDSVLLTWTSWSGHPEVRGGDNDAISSDWVGVTRDVLEARYGGTAVHMPESLGGMQSALGGDIPLVDEQGELVLKTCTQEDVDGRTPLCAGKTVGDVATYPDGLEAPVWAERDSWDFVRSHGWHIAQAAIDALDEGITAQADPLRVEVEDGWVPVRNVAYNLLGPRGIFDIGLEDATQDVALCPGAGDRGVTTGCLPFRVFRAQVGPVGFASAPGELLPEMAWGLPNDPAFALESEDAALRGITGIYFPQQSPACADVAWEDCRDALAVGNCDCLSMHAVPYRISDDPALHPVLDDLDTPYKAAISMTSTYLSYVVPEPSTNRVVSLLTDDGDHYEDTVTPAWDFGDVYLKTWNRLNARW